MSYFNDAHDSIRYVLSRGDEKPGLRKSQIGALHAISSHFTIQSRPALVVLPTGAGKTAVLMLTPYILSARRALVITPSRFVREQISLDYQNLRTLKYTKSVPEVLSAPNIYENKKVIDSLEKWDSLRQFDIVLSTPNSASPGHYNIPFPPVDLFDLVLIDEAHHSPAPTWNALIDSFPQAMCVLFTATPFRRDGKEIKGKYVYSYPIQRAFEDGIYGDMHYIPIDPPVGVNSDVALARETERAFLQDKKAGFDHAIMVRAETQSRANELTLIYQQNTQLRLEIAHSGKSHRQIDQAIQRLRQGELDGIICVDMLGEGFDFPKLKIAALHEPHRSLSVTLQFFGRFARVNGANLGEAKFLAVESEIKDGLSDLFQQTEAWGQRIRTIGQKRISKEIELREFIEEFNSNRETKDDASLEDLSLYSFSVFNHVKIYKVHGTVNLQSFPSISGLVTERVWLNDLRSTVIFLFREEQQPKWTSSSILNRIEHHLVIVYYDESSSLMFICSTYREEDIFREIAENITNDPFIPLSLSKINRALRSYSHLELFNVGMRNRATGTVAETYRQLSGPSVHQAIDKADGALYHRGHIFGRGQTYENTTTIGISSLSKVWRLEHTKILDLIKWCQSLARDINNSSPFSTGIALDHLDAGMDITTLPTQMVVAADWQDHIYQEPPFIGYEDENSTQQRISLLDFDLLIDQQESNPDRIVVKLQAKGVSSSFRFTIIPYPTIDYLDEEQPRLFVSRGIRSINLTKYLSDNPLRLHFADGSLLEGSQLFTPDVDSIIFDANSQMESINWQIENVNIQKEFGVCHPPQRSIQDWLRDMLINNGSSIVFFDHRSGECADFLTVDECADSGIAINLYHCKAAKGESAGDRLEDVEELIAQVIKSSHWGNKKVLLRHVCERARSGSNFEKGDLSNFIRLIESHPLNKLTLQVYAVQPGLSKRNLSNKLALLLSSASRGLMSSGYQRLKVICSG